MASTNSRDLIVGSLVSFTSNTIPGKSFKGTVYFFNPEDACFAIENESRTMVRGGYNCVQGYLLFFLKDIKDLRVLRVPSPQPTTNTTKDDDQKSNPGNASSSSTRPAR